MGTVRSEDRMDDGTRIALAVTIDRRDGSAEFDFSGTGPEVFGNTNAPPAVTMSAVIYSLRCLVSRDIPLNGGCLAPVKIKARSPAFQTLFPHFVCCSQCGCSGSASRRSECAYRVARACRCPTAAC